ncbi:MAG TPA: hypothetical protein VFG10_14855, partial [Saprospiraceae bacterium]|nr:hypothetical protein [Saprospiraceae bacterium]
PVSQTITVQDVTVPVLSGQGIATTIDCPSTPDFTAPTATDDCDETPAITSSDATTPGECAGSYTITRTWLATDACGNTSLPVSQTITVQDVTVPVLSGQGEASTIDCPSTPTFTAPTATDDCDATPVITSSDATVSGECAGSYTITRTWLATDACGNTSLPVSQTITVQDITAPVLSGQGVAETIDCPSAPAFTAPTAADDCDGTPVITSSDATTPGECAGSYTITRTWLATDACGNTSPPVSQTITVQDITAPVLSGQGIATTIDCPSTPDFTAPTATDDCDLASVITFTDVTVSGACAGAYTITRTWLATDACGNTSLPVSQTITVQDVTVPVLSGQGEATTIDCPSTPAFTAPTATDDCDLASDITFTDVTVSGACAGAYTITRTWLATDACGNTSLPVSQTITVQDVTVPVLSGQGVATTIDCPSTPDFTAPTATDDCDATPNITSSDATIPGKCAGSYSITRTWLATDACGNTSLPVSQTITVQDVTAPVLSGQGEASTIDCPSTPDFTAPTATDDCDETPVITSSDATIPGECAGSYSMTRTWLATDACGNTSLPVSQTITVQDVTVPVLSGQGVATTIDCPSTPAFTAPTATDDCDLASVITFTDVTVSGACAGSYSITRTWFATDACGNTSLPVSQTITVQDVTAPVLLGQGVAETIDCPSTPDFTAPTATDDCDATPVITSSDATVSGECAGSYTITRTWLATDACGNTSLPVSQAITVQDVTAPVIAVLPTEALIDCSEIPVFAVALATDVCGSAFTLNSNDVTTPGLCAGAYSITRTWTATDACGNVSFATQTINVQDITAPVIAALPNETTIDCSETPVFATATATDACGSDFTLNSNDETTPGLCAGSYSITRTWTATDECDNVSSATQTINVQDITAPVISALPTETTIDCSETPVFATATATDACGSDFTLNSNDVTTPGLCAGSYSITRTWTTTDACGNVSFAVQTINVQDITAPVIAALPTETTIDCSETPVFATATATDACGSDFTLNSNDVTTPGLCSGSYSITRTWTATDECDNISSAAQTINVQDITAPVIAALPTETTIDCSETPVFATATATDACGSDFTLNSNDVTTPGLCAGSYSITRTWTATDECDNVSSATQTINVQDITAPVIAALPNETTIDCSGTPVFAMATATDACGSDFTLNSNDVTTPGVCAGSYRITRTWTATDECDNVSSATQTINVQDITAPIIAALPNETTIECSEIAVFAVATAIDACGSDFTLNSIDMTTPGVCAGSYSITRIWTATDACGNISKTSQTINVEDTTPPVIAALPAETAIDCSDTPVFAVPTATDACDASPVVTYNDATVSGTCAGNYSVTRTWLATDACGNTSLPVSQTITVQDITAPMIAALPNETTIDCSETPVFAMATATDACGSDFTLNSNDVTTSGVCAGSYSITRTWTATDACGNVSFATQTINVQDITAPVIEALPAETTIKCPETPMFEVATATDACGSDFTLNSNDVITPGECAGSYSTTRTWTATDACGNVSFATQTINVLDITAPLITCPADITVLFGESTAHTNTGSATAIDNCDQNPQISYTDSTPDNTCSSENPIIRTWTAMDACGNASTCQQHIFVNERGTICGSVYNISGEPLPNVEIRLEADINNNKVFDSGDTLVAIVYSDLITGQYCFTNIRTCNFILVKSSPGPSDALYDYDFTPDPDGDDSSDGPDNQIPVSVSPGENDADNNFVENSCQLMVSNTMDAGPGSFRDVAGCAVAGDTIRFDASLAGQTIHITSDRIEVDKQLIIMSTLLPKLIIESEIPGLFDIRENGVAKIMGLNLVSGTTISGNMGAAFENSGSLTLHNVNICRNENLPDDQYLIRNSPGALIYITGSCSLNVNCYSTGVLIFHD